MVLKARPPGLDPGDQMGALFGCPSRNPNCKLLKRLVGERGFEPPTPWSRKRDSGVVLNVFNLVEWCFDHLSPVQSPHSGVNVSPRMAVPHQGFNRSASKDHCFMRSVGNCKFKHFAAQMTTHCNA